MFNKLNYKGFTLAEILIVLAILGIVSVLVIPAAINNYRKFNTVSRLKIAYSLLQKAVDNSVIYNGPISQWDFSRADGWGQSTKSESFAKTYLIPEFKVVEECRFGDNSTKCFYNNGDYINAFYTYTGVPPATYNAAQGSYQFRINNDMSFAVFVAWNGTAGTADQVRINVDIDGPNKGKSILGEDVFVFQISKSKGLLPYSYGCDNCRPPWNKNSTYTHTTDCNLAPGAQYSGGGHSTCANKIIQNGWKIPKDYPFFK